MPDQGMKVPQAQLLTEKQVSIITGLAVATLRNWRCKRVGPPSLKLGGAVRYRAADIDRWIERLGHSGADA